MAKYIYSELKTRDGERVYEHKSLHTFDNDNITHEEVDEFLDDYVSEFWGESDGKEDYYYWFFGEIVSWVYNWNFISEKEYKVLKKFL